MGRRRGPVFANRVAGEIAESAHLRLRDDIASSADGLRSSLRDEIASWAAETRRHFDVVAEANRAQIRVLADPIGRNTERLDQHDSRITKLERRSK